MRGENDVSMGCLAHCVCLRWSLAHTYTCMNIQTPESVRTQSAHIAYTLCMSSAFREEVR